MSTTRMLIDRIKAERQLTSDGQVAKALGVTRSAVSRWQKGQDAMSLELVGRVRELLPMSDMEWAEIGLRLTLERSQNDPAAARFWRYCVKVWSTSRHSASILLVWLALLTAHGKARATELDVVLGWDLSNSQSIYYAH